MGRILAALVILTLASVSEARTVHAILRGSEHSRCGPGGCVRLIPEAEGQFTLVSHRSGALTGRSEPGKGSSGAADRRRGALFGQRQLSTKVMRDRRPVRFGLFKRHR